MNRIILYPIGSTDACAFAAVYLKEAGIFLTDHPSPEVTHLLLDIPSFAGDGSLRGGGELTTVLERLPERIAVIGGNLNHAALAGYPTLDLLKDPEYLAKNAAITAECALRVASPLLRTVFPDAPALVIGWGRIGKCLARLLNHLGCPVTIAARNPSDRAMAAALGYHTRDISQIPEMPADIRLLFNTVPAPVLKSDTLDKFDKCIKIELASSPGLIGNGIIHAGGLPAQYAPESSGKLIAQTVVRHLREGTI